MDDVWTKSKCTVINFELKMNENYHVEHVTREWRKKNNPKNPKRIQTFDLIPFIWVKVVSGKRQPRHLMKRKLIPLTEPKNELFPLCVTLFVPGDNVLMHDSELCCGNLPFLGTMRDYSQLSLRQTPLGPAISVRLREMSIL